MRTAARYFIMADQLNLVGKTFAGYAVEKRIGAGGMGVVYRVFDDRLRRVVALKVLPPEMAREEETRQRFLREGRTAAKIDHGNAVRLLAAGEEKKLAYLVMEFVDRGSLQQRIDRFKKLSAAESLSLAKTGNQRVRRDVERMAARAAGKPEPPPLPR